MSIIDDLIPVVDAARKAIEDTGFRIHEVKFVTLTWPYEIGIGQPIISSIRMEPQPKVLKYRAEEILVSGGTKTEADLNISKISKTYSLAQLMGHNIGPNQEFFWEIDGVYYKPIAHQERAISWNIQVRRTNRNA